MVQIIIDSNNSCLWIEFRDCKIISKRIDDSVER